MTQSGGMCRMLGTLLSRSAHQVKMQYLQNIKHSRYIHLMSNFLSIHFHTKRLYVHMFDIVDTPLSYGRGLIVCSSLQEFWKTKESTLWGRDAIICTLFCILLFCYINNLEYFCNKKSYWHSVFSFSKLNGFSLQLYLKLISDQGRHVTHSAWSGHICRSQTFLISSSPKGRLLFEAFL